jgi:hypothetical protein
MRRVQDFRAVQGFDDVKDTLEVLDFGLKLQDAIRASLADKRITVLDAIHLFAPLTSAGAAFDGIVNIKRELADMTPEGRAIVVAYVQDRFTIANEDLERLVMETIDEVMGDLTVGFKWASYRKNRFS